MSINSLLYKQLCFNNRNNYHVNKKYERLSRLTDPTSLYWRTDKIMELTNKKRRVLRKTVLKVKTQIQNRQNSLPSVACIRRYYIFTFVNTIMYTTTVQLIRDIHCFQCTVYNKTDIYEYIYL